jgi:4-amino-4-deoxy-L-arabinose transferase-like glycosyltransferase
MEKETKILIALFLIAFVIRGVFTLSTPLRIWDETVYADLGYDLSRNPLDYSVRNNGWSDFIPSGGDDLYAWPKMGFRAPLLPYLLSLFYLFNLDLLVIFFVVFIGALSVVPVYVMGKKLFNEKVSLYSSIFFLLTPLHVTYSAKILTGVLFTFFVLLTFLSFWKGYEEENKKHKVLFGAFLALSLLARYTTLWIMPIFLLYFLARDRSLKFIKDKYLWYSILAFFLILVPWLVYGSVEYNHPLGAFIHGAKASAYWGGVQNWHFFFDYWWQMFSIIGVVFILGVFYILYKKEFLKKEIYLLLIWFAFFLGIAIYMPHKEDRFILAIVPTIALISGFFFDRIRAYKKIILIGIILITSFSLYSQFSATYGNSYTGTNICFLESNRFLERQSNALIITDESPIVYHYTEEETHFYPDPWSYGSLDDLIKKHYSDKESFVLFTDFDMPLNDDEHIRIKDDLDKNLKKVFECSKDRGYAAVYQFSENA